MGDTGPVVTETPRLILLVEDHPMVRSLVERSLAADGFEVESFATARDAIRNFHAIDPDALVTDIDLGERPNGIELATLLRAQAPYLGIVFLSNYASVDAVEGGAGAPPGASFVHKSLADGPEVLREAIEATLDDTQDPLVVTLPDDQPLGRLSAPQLTMLRYIAEGWSNAEIAERRSITLRSAERLISRTFHALGLTDDPAINPRVIATRMYIRTFGVPEPEERPAP